MNDYKFGNFVCRLREGLGLTQAEVAKRLGVTAAAVSKWENGSAKPRVEVLFQLAGILGVRPEELMAGQFLTGAQPSPEAIQAINERYEYLRRIELHNTTKTKLLRMVGWVIDWNLIGIPVLLLCGVLLPLLCAWLALTSTQTALVVLLGMLCYPVCFALRDLIWGGRSLGKRILGLTILSTHTGTFPRRYQLLVRGLFLFLLQIDAVLMLVTGRSLGDNVAHTVVVSKKDVEQTAPPSPHESARQMDAYATRRTAPKPPDRKRIALWVCIAVAALLAFIILILSITAIGLESQKDSEEYQIAYNYFLESERFAELGISPEDLSFNRYEVTTIESNGTVERRAEIGFRFHTLQTVAVILHDKGDGWVVCKECTGF